MGNTDQDPSVQAPDDPYQPPQSLVEDSDINLSHRELPQAGPWRRLATHGVDLLAFYAVVFLLAIVVVLVFGEQALKPVSSGPMSYVIPMVLLFVYYTFFEAMWHRTPGKWAAGTRVIDASGAPPSLKQVALRSVCRMIPFEAFSMLGDGIGWHDTIPKTRVVRVRGVGTAATLR